MKWRSSCTLRTQIDDAVPLALFRPVPITRSLARQRVRRARPGTIDLREAQVTETPASPAEANRKIIRTAFSENGARVATLRPSDALRRDRGFVPMP